uniref:WAP four-disulfide core domain protein 3-like n=1 Tax=Geotrypetes seraphini TaxID=260995 RepID=A0A6P8RS50_GEOSA|nr:WAP four-disulfide core domain protein 3-like [Geotrypetes seraphini]
MKASGGIFLFVVFLTLQRAESFEKPGMCLDPRCNLNCNDDKDCSGNNKCCKSPCGRTCRPPVFYSRPLWNDRDCPDNLEPCCDPNNRNDDDDGCRGDRDCDRNYKCCLKGCRRECVKVRWHH